MSFRWVVGLAAFALLFVGMARAAGTRVYVNNQRSPDGERRPAILWESQAAQRDCVETATLRLQRYLLALQVGEQVPYSALELSACTAGEVADLAQGTAVEILPGDECGTLTHVRVVAGRSEDKAGCISGDRLSAQRVP